MFDDIWTDEMEQGFIIDNDQKAEWALKKVSEIDQEYKRLIDICEKQIDFYENKILGYEQKRNNQRSGLIGMLARYFETVPSKATKTQATYKFPSGKLVYKFEKQSLKPDNDLLIEQLKDTPFVEMKPSLKWGEYKETLKIIGDKVIDESGEIVEGVSVETKAAVFNVEVLT